MQFSRRGKYLLVTQCRLLNVTVSPHSGLPSLQEQSATDRFVMRDKTGKIASKRAIQSGGSAAHYNSERKVAEELISDFASPPPPRSKAEREASSHRPEATSYRYSARLLSGKLRASSCVHPVNPENLQNLAIGIQKSPYDRLVSQLTTMSQVKKSMQELYTRRNEPSNSNAKPPPPASINKPNSPSDQGLTLNQLDITHECSEHEGLLEESAIFSGPAVELFTEDAPFQEHLFKPKNMAITFAKPRKLFRVKSMQQKLQQHTYFEEKTAKNRGKTPREHTAAKRQSESSYNMKHRLALNKENAGSEEGVFGTQNHFSAAASCVVRSQERRKLRLKTAAPASYSRAAERNRYGNGSTRKVQVYLIKTTRPLEDILPELNSSEICCQENGRAMDPYGE